MFYTILYIKTGVVFYRGIHLNRAAVALVPGTCFGKGHSQQDADRLAERWRQKFLADGYCKSSKEAA